MPGPKRLDERYEALAPDWEWVELHLAARYLNKSVDEWRALPWWQRRLYLDGFRAEGLIEDGPPQASMQELGLTVKTVEVQPPVGGVSP